MGGDGQFIDRCSYTSYTCIHTRRRRRHVVAQLQKPLEARAAVLGPGPIVAVGEEEDEAFICICVVNGECVGSAYVRKGMHAVHINNDSVPDCRSHLASPPARKVSITICAPLTKSPNCASQMPCDF